MKKLAKYGLASVVALSFAACDNYEEPNPQPQTNPQESILKTDDIAVADSLAGAAYDLTQLNADGKSIVVGSVLTSKLPPLYEFVADVEISSDGFTRVGKVPAKVTQTADTVYTVSVSPDDLNGAFVEAVSKGPKAKEIALRYRLETKIDNQIAYVGGTGKYYGPYKMTVTPFPSQLVIEKAYYVLGTINGWSVAEAKKLSHSDENQYDDPVFTIKVDITPDQAKDGWWWKIVPQSTFSTGDWVNANGGQFGVATNGDEAMKGALVGMTVDAEGKVTLEPGAGCVKEAGQWLLSINLEEGTYEFSSAVDFLYTPGATNGWNQGNSQLLSTEDYATYKGVAKLSPDGFKFSSAPDWDHVNYGAGADTGTLSTDVAAGNLSVATAGLYFCEVNTASLTYKTSLISTMGLIGDATPGAWDASTALTTTDQLVWTGTVKMKNGEYKFRANDAWDIDFGGAANDLKYKGDNIKWTQGEGDYDVTLDFSKIPYSATFVKK